MRVKEHIYICHTCGHVKSWFAKEYTHSWDYPPKYVRCNHYHCTTLCKKKEVGIIHEKDPNDIGDE